MTLKGLVLLSGGIDSPVAAYQIKQKKVQLEAVYFDNFPFSGESTKRRTLDSARLLDLKLYIIKSGPYLLEYMKNCEKKYQCVYCRRMMYRISEQLAKKINAEFIVTGEDLAQVASQTLPNLYVITEAATIPIVRPLIGFDKSEIITIAKKIGTYDISTQPAMCCKAVPRKPSTSARLENILREERKLNISKLVREALKSVKKC